MKKISLSVKEFSRIHKIDHFSVYRSIWSGRIKAIKINRNWFISEAESENFKKYGKHKACKEVK